MLFLKFSSTEYMIGISNIKIAFFSFVEKLYVNKVSALMYKQNNPLLLKQTASEFIRFFSIQSDTNLSVSKYRISPVVEKSPAFWSLVIGIIILVVFELYWIFPIDMMLSITHTVCLSLVESNYFLPYLMLRQAVTYNLFFYRDRLSSLYLNQNTVYQRILAAYPLPPTAEFWR